MLRRHMAFYSGVHDLARIFGLLRVVVAGPVHLLVSSAASIGLVWLPDLCIWQRPGLPAPCQFSCPFQFFRGWLSGLPAARFSGFNEDFNFFPPAGRR